MNRVGTMDPRPGGPVTLGRLRSVPALAGLGLDPISGARRLHAANGPFVLLTYPNSRASRPRMMACIASSELYRTVSSNGERWRTVNVFLQAAKSSAANRLNRSMTRLQGARHAHYRRLFLQNLAKPAVASVEPMMARLARANVEAWPRDRELDLVGLASDLMQDFAITILFGGDRQRAMPVAKMIHDAIAAAWPFPGPAYFRWLRTAPRLERAIEEWAAEKKGELNPKDIFSVLVNSPDERGGSASREIVGGLLTFTFGAAYDTCQNALIWTLILLAQHPEVAAALGEEIEEAIGDGPPAMDRLGRLALLDGVVKEGMRLFPPVPIQFRRSLVDTELGGVSVPSGMRVLTSVFLVNRDPDHYPEPERFLPERWRGMVRPPHEYPVFGAGSRMCPGSMFGDQMVKMALAAIFSSHRIELPARARIDYRSAITLTPRSSVPVVLRGKGEAVRRSVVTGSIRELVALPGLA